MRVYGKGFQKHQPRNSTKGRLTKRPLSLGSDGQRSQLWTVRTSARDLILLDQPTHGGRTHLDASFFLNQFAQFQQSVEEFRWRLLWEILAYLKRNLFYRIVPTAVAYGNSTISYHYTSFTY